MGAAQSKPPEIKAFRQQNKKIARQLGFYNNKKAAKHQLNRRHKDAKDPRSRKQIEEWEGDSSRRTEGTYFHKLCLLST